MPNYTKHFKLEQPLAEEFYDVNVQNANMEKIDTTLKDVDARSADGKGAPVDGDSLVLVDSEDSNKIKLTTWGKIKAALGKVFAALVHGHTMEQITGLVAAMSNKANVLPEATPENTGHATLLAYLMSLHRPSAYRFKAQGFPDLPTADAYDVTSAIVAEVVVQAVRVLSGGRDTRLRGSTSDGSAWAGDWVPQATAEPPQEYDLPLAAGMADYGTAKSRYWKNQFGEGTVVVDIVPGTTMGGGAILATLPAGYRPTVSTDVNATGLVGNTFVPLRLFFGVTGNINLSGGQEAVQYREIFATAHYVVAA